MSKYSMTGTGIVVAALAWVIQFFFGEVVDNEILFSFVTTAGEWVGYAAIIYGQIRRKDLRAGIVRVR